MKMKFEEPSCEFIYLDNETIVTSGCACWDGTTDHGVGADEDCPDVDNPECSCSQNYDPSLPNCICETVGD